ncbi:DUF3772 domain-containing protein [Rhodoferax koreense]|nr:DUF3772 domain-containing protein [Rhodoferax koreense]
MTRLFCFPPPRSLFLAVLMALCLACGAARAQQAAAAPVDDDAALDQARSQIQLVQKSLATARDDDSLLALRTAALAARDQADATATRLAPQLAGVQARLAELGAPPADKKEPADIAKLRADLEKSRVTLDANVKLARLLSVEGEQAADQIWAQRRSQFQAHLGERTASILAKPFWSELADNFVQDAGRLSSLGAQLSAAVARTTAGVWAGGLLAVVLIVGLRLWAGRAVLRVVTTRVPPGRLRRSLYALLHTALAALAPGLIAMVAYQVLVWDAPLPDTADELLTHTVGLLIFGGYVTGLGNALLSPARPSWRLSHMPDGVARGLRAFPLALGVITVAGWVAERLYALVNASLATTVALNCIQALALGLVMVWVVMRGERLRRIEEAETKPREDGPPRRPTWLAALTAVVWLVLVTSIGSLVLGYVAFGSFAVRQVAWFGVVVLSAYLLSVFIDDVCMGWLAVREPEGAADAPANAADKPVVWRLRNQFAVLLSGALRVFIALVALILIVAPFGEGPSELFQRTGEISAGLSIGEVNLRPDAVLQALLVLVLGLTAVRLLKGWLTAKLLPTTSLDAGMQTSAVTLFNYAGVVLAVALAMSAVGIGLERIAWVASALSVGIGFGLQAVVQNFVSGLILLAERPVKVGDWVALGGVEGDIRRINVRATEIQMGDRSTVIVPNSEFITKTVRNVTMASPLGLVQIKLPMPLDTDALRVRDLLLAAFQAHGDVLDSPAPNVALDGIDNGRLVFNATGYVNSPRLAYNVRSALLFEVLQQLREAKLTLSNPSTILMGPGLTGLGGPPAVPPPLA